MCEKKKKKQKQQQCLSVILQCHRNVEFTTKKNFETQLTNDFFFVLTNLWPS